jgi:hypothetical protein
VRKHEGEIPLARKRCRWEDNIRMDLKEIDWEGVDWIGLATFMIHLGALKLDWPSISNER